MTRPLLSARRDAQTVTTATADLSAGLIFEQEPSQILDALLPLYLSSTLLRALQVPVLSSTCVLHTGEGDSCLVPCSLQLTQERACMGSI